MRRLAFRPIDFERHADICVRFRRDAHACSFGSAAGFDAEYGPGGSRYLSWLRDRASDAPAAVVHAWRGDRIVGQIEARVRREPPSGYVNLFYLVPEERGTGAADELHEYVVDLFGREGVHRVELSVGPGNLRALRYYRKHGWRDLGPREDHPEVHLMALEIGDASQDRLTRRVSPPLRRATHADAAGICRVHADAVRQRCKLHYTADEIEAWVGRLRPGSHVEDIESLEFFVATDHDEGILGFGVLDPGESEVKAVYVHPSATRRGVASALLRHLEAVARDRGLARLHLDASLNSVEFYIAAEYVPQDVRRHPLRSGVAIRCVSMSKDLVSKGGTLGMPQMPIYLVPYDDSWPALFEEERLELLRALGEQVLAVEHIGSTAIPGIMAKPVIDVMVVIPDICDAPAFFDPLEGLHYQYFPYDEERTPERRWFCKPNPVQRTHHLHLVEVGSPSHRGSLAFRDFVRADPEEAARYEALKRDLAARFPSDREAYTKGKAEYVRSVIEKAKTA